MTYKTILVHADLSPHAPARYALACALAASQQAHLVGAAATGVNMELLRNASLALGEPLSQDDIDAMRQRATQALEQLEQQAREADISYESRSSDDDPDAALVLQARYADLVVVSQPDPGRNTPALVRQLPEHLLLHSGRPLLLAPCTGRHLLPQRHAVVAWDGSRAATRAITDALPLLTRIPRVTLAVVDAHRHPGAHGELPGADMALYLARHGVQVELRQERSGDGHVAGALLRVVEDCDADLLVMGGYGHQRWREIVLGGVTRRVLEAMQLPVLMAH